MYLFPKKIFTILVFIIISTVTSVGQNSPHFPLKISKNKRYFIDQDGKPFLYHADTGWQIFVKLTTEEAREYLTFRKEQGFNTIQVQLAMTPGLENRYGQKAFFGESDFSRPNEAYYDHVLKVIHIADSLGLLIVMSQPWVGCCLTSFGGAPDRPIYKNGPAKNKQYGQYLGKKFASCKNLFWIMGGDNDPKGDRECLLSFFNGLRETAPRHQLMTYHASPPHSSTDLFQYEPWLGFSMIYTYWREKINNWPTYILMPHVYEAALREWSKTDTIPFVLGESQYEGDGSLFDNDNGSPRIIRRQAYWTMLCGGAGHAYGSDIWFFSDNWRDIMKYQGAYQMGHFIKFFEQIPWWTLIPDTRHLAVVDGYGEWAKADYVTAALSPDKKLMVAYIPLPFSVTVNFGYLQGDSFRVRFYDPQTGKFIKDTTVDEKSVQRVISPAAEDLVLLIEAK